MTQFCRPGLNIISGVGVYRWQNTQQRMSSIYIVVVYASPQSHQSSLPLYLRPETRHALMLDLNEPPKHEEQEKV